MYVRPTFLQKIVVHLDYLYNRNNEHSNFSGLDLNDTRLVPFDFRYFQNYFIL